jgi:hypothetical protein
MKKHGRNCLTRCITAASTSLIRPEARCPCVSSGSWPCWLYKADPNNQMYSDRTWENISGRVTWQITPRNKFGAFWDEQGICRKCTGATTGITDPARVTPEATGVGATKQEGPARFLPTPIIFPESDGVNAYKDLTPRFGASWDVFGNGKTAIKASLGKYLEGVGVQLNYANANPSLRMPQTTSVFGTAGVTRTWTDANNNFVPDCDLLNPAAQDLRAQGKDQCGAMSNLLFGQNILTNNYDPALLTGWGVRASDWDLGVTVQQQIMPRASLEVAYTRRWYNGFTVTDNLATANSDWSPYSITAPADSRLPGGGNYVVSGLYDVNPAKFGQINNFITDSKGYGGEYQYFNGLDVTLNVRLRAGLILTGGTSTGQTVADACAARASLPELNVGIGAGLVGSTVSTTSPYCHVAYGILTQARGLGSYVIPKIDVQLSGVFQSKPGALLSANYAVPNAAVVPSLGRSLAGNAPNVTVNLIAPGSQYGDRVNQLDFRVAKILKFGRTRTMAGIDLYNALNSSAILTYNNTFVPSGTWLQPVTILTGRLIKFSAEITF